jgi:hypothetical protein
MAKEKTSRVIRISKQVKRVFKQIQLDLEDMGIERRPDELADELFELGVYTKQKELKK